MRKKPYSEATIRSTIACLKSVTHQAAFLFSSTILRSSKASAETTVPFPLERMLVTVLFKYTQPLIRYEIEDSARFATSVCTCGRPFKLIDGIQGRRQEILPSIAGGSVKIHPLAFHNIMDTLPLSAWQVVQEADGLRVLLAGVHRTIDDRRVRNLVRVLASQEAAVPHIEVDRVLSIPQTISGKTHLVKFNVPRS